MRIQKNLILSLILLLALLLSSCDGSGGTVDMLEVETTNIAIVCGYHRNAPMPPISEVATAIKVSVTGCGSVIIVVNDGDPFTELNVSIDQTEVEKKSEKRREQFFEDISTEIIAALAEAKAVTPEVNTLEAIWQAARGLSSADGDKCIYILDSGLTTKGDLNILKDNLLQLSDIDAFVEYLKESYALPDLTGIDVVWFGLGDVTGEQEDLTSIERHTLEELWRKTLETAGAKSVDFRETTTQPDAEDYADLPAVTTIPIMQKDFFPSGINSVKLSFVSNSDEFVDIDEARELLQPIAGYLIAHPDYSVVLAGTTATVGSNESCKEFSLKRAIAAGRLLVEMGVSEKQISRTIGIGYEHEFHVHDLNADGSLNENAQENRAVLITGASTEYAQRILKYE